MYLSYYSLPAQLGLIFRWVGGRSDKQYKMLFIFIHVPPPLMSELRKNE